MIKTKDELIAAISAAVGDNDEGLQILEDFSDTFADMDGEYWKRKYEENDADWRKRYKERFMQGAPEPGTTLEGIIEGQTKQVKEDGEKRTFEELFEEVEG